MREQVIESILENKIIAIVRGADEEKVPKIAQALYEGGVKLMEVTFNQKDPASFVHTQNAIRKSREREVLEPHDTLRIVEDEVAASEALPRVFGRTPRIRRLGIPHDALTIDLDLNVLLAHGNFEIEPVAVRRE